MYQELITHHWTAEVAYDQLQDLDTLALDNGLVHVGVHVIRCSYIYV